MIRMKKKKEITYSVDVYRSINRFTLVDPMGYEIFTNKDVPDITHSRDIIELIAKRRFDKVKYDIRYYDHYGRSVIYYRDDNDSTCVVYFNNLHVIKEEQI